MTTTRQQTISKPRPAYTPGQSGLLQRKCACGSHTPAGGECAGCKLNRLGLQRKASDYSEAPPIVHDVVRSPGQPLDPGIRSFMEPCFGRDFSQVRLSAKAIRPMQAGFTIGAPNDVFEQEADRVAERVVSLPEEPSMRAHAGYDFGGVRIHTGDAASRSARVVDARAYTLGRHIVFGAGAYSPDTRSGRELLAHELTHTIQQEAGGGAPQPLLQRAPNMSGAGTEAVHRGGTLPYREAKELAECIRIMGESSAAYCREEVLHEPSAPALSAQAKSLAQELQTIINGAVWKEIRKRVYPLESAAGIKRARDRHAALLPDMTGLGRLSSLEHFATQIRDVQAKWPSFATPDDRVKEVGKATNAELKSAEVPEFLVVDKEPMEFKGFFSPREWKFVLSEELVSSGTLLDKDAAELANTALHEGRHAEQQFLAARFSAGVGKKDAVGIQAEQKIPRVIADAAVAKKFDATTDAATKTLGKQMFKATVTDRAVNQAISNDDGLDDLKKRRAEAMTALADLRAADTPQTFANATGKRDALKAQIADVERRYKLYRNIPYEADAHEVGDAAEEAFKGWP